MTFLSVFISDVTTLSELAESSFSLLSTWHCLSSFEMGHDDIGAGLCPLLSWGQLAASVHCFFTLERFCLGKDSPFQPDPAFHLFWWQQTVISQPFANSACLAGFPGHRALNNRYWPTFWTSVINLVICSVFSAKRTNKFILPRLAKGQRIILLLTRPVVSPSRFTLVNQIFLPISSLKATGEY